MTMPCHLFEQLCLNFIDHKGKRSRLFKELMFDQYGNYIATKLFEKAKCYALAKIYDHFCRTFNESVDALKKCRHGRQLIGKFETIQYGGKKTKQSAGPSSSSSSVASKMSN